jgi:DNA-binding beta-propeller fold protein YncE
MAARNAFVVVLLALLPSASASPADSMLSLVGSIALPGVTDASATMKLDHSVMVGNLLFVAAKENNTVAVVDLDAGAFVASVPVPFPQGMARSAALGLVFVASSSAGTLSALSAAPPFAVAWSVRVGGDCDNVRAVDTPGGAAPARVYVAFGGGASGNGAVAAIDATLASGTIAFTTDVGSDHPEELNLSPISNFVTVSVPAPAAGGGGVRVLSTDPARPLLGYWSGEGQWSAPYAQSIDATGQRLWLATAGAVDPPIGSQLLALNALDGSLLFAAPTGDAGASCDEIAIDEAGGLVFAAKGGPASRLFVVQQTAQRWDAGRCSGAAATQLKQLRPVA